ncbi:carbohydrate ABC transporter permease [Cohnella zeiphila]|uniref:Sugar ABC transporter permease n=1 Tax=Cohnella zeiphila TaxID=2761120 RepID=A0A7X0VYJ0_9BACL|nr:sugar ABC transporter permease [Cohnella zeiphila]MBB6735414.1 sugar ABC transporter permease [Cohnella zeiphila]
MSLGANEAMTVRTDASRSVVTLSRRKRTRYAWAYLFVLPQVVFFAAFTIYPIAMSYVYSFYEWSGIGPLEDSVGWSNFSELLRDPAFWNAFRNSLIYIGATAAILLPSSLLLALVLNRAVFRGKVFYRTVYFLPVVTAASTVGIVMKFIFGNENALVNGLLLKLGLLSEPVPWLGQAGTAMGVLVLVGSWKFFGMAMVYWLAGLQSLPGEAFEAARIDGAGSAQVLRYVTLPLLRPVAAVVLLLTVVNSMHVFDLVKTLTGGGPFYATETVDLYIYNYAFNTSGFPRIGYASAAGIVFGLAIFLLTLLLGWLVQASRERGERPRRAAAARGGGRE